LIEAVSFFGFIFGLLGQGEQGGRRKPHFRAARREKAILKGSLEPLKCMASAVSLPFTFWTDLGNKQPSFVKMTEEGMLTDHNCSINWKVLISFC